MDLELFREVIRTVDWTEPWLWGLAGFHVATFVSILLLRKHHYLQAVVLSVLAVLCFASEYVNEWAANNYQRFAGDQYFDSSGFFIFLVYATPIILNCFLIVLMWLCDVCALMSDMATARGRQMRKRITQQQRQQQRDSKKSQ